MRSAWLTLMETQKAGDSGGLTEAERVIVEGKRQRALALQRAKVVANDRQDVYTSSKKNFALSQAVDSGAGFFLEPEWSTQPVVPDLYEKSEEEEDDIGSDVEVGGGGRKRRRRRRQQKRTLVATQETAVGTRTVDDAATATAASVVPVPPDESQSVCDECGRSFAESFLLNNFDCEVCDACRDVHGIHSLITRTSAKERYLLNDVDLDVRTPVLRCIFKRNPHNATWGDMRLYLEAQVAARSLEIWGSEAALEAERARRSTQRENLKLKSFEKKLKTLRMQTRSSLFSKKSEQHEHSFGSETYDEAKDIYFKTCTTCNFVVEFEKL
nr:unnamed protein product [Spirometra erinaceieuropaei]